MEQIWENMSLIAVDVGAFRDAIFAANRLMELRKRFDDFDVRSPDGVVRMSIVFGSEPFMSACEYRFLKSL